MSHFCETNRSVRGFVCHLRVFEPKTLELLADHGERWNEKVIAAASGKVALEPAERPLDITRSLPDTLTLCLCYFRHMPPAGVEKYFHMAVLAMLDKRCFELWLLLPGNRSKSAKLWLNMAKRRLCGA
ncbi:hypothetical protein Q7C36_019735 [Tachysurus vachellii]|uniref:Uncharacterized protein n=1 Tax=Tachysurus vachellii TaxID=175792 RepID=A0AA88LSD9_TACVA|nr:hypothetical protein Q7C36_019735 [Tachysurus vachellii]